MQKLSIQYQGKKQSCVQYGPEDEPAILDVFFFWKTAVLLAEQTKSKKPQLPETFSEPFCCLVCNLIHKPGAGVDAFRLNASGQTEAAVEIKATITDSGFTDIKRDLNFDELYWLSLADYNSLSYKIHKLTKQELTPFIAKSGTQRDRATVNLKNIVAQLQITPVFEGRIGIVRGASSQSVAVSPDSITTQVQQLPATE